MYTIEYLTSPVNHGANTTLIAQTKPEAVCNITVYYKSGTSKAQGLYSKTTDSNSKVSWTWKVGTRTTPGFWKIVIKSNYAGKIISLSTCFTVR